MALYIPGMICALCGKPMNAGDDITGFSSFVANRKDPLFLFSDGVFHTACFQRHPLSDKAQRRWAETRSRIGPGGRICVVCHQAILNPDDYFTLGHLTDDPASPIYEFNFFQAHRRHLLVWEKYASMRSLVEEFQSSSAWDGPRAAFP